MEEKECRLEEGKEVLEDRQKKEMKWRSRGGKSDTG